MIIAEFFPPLAGLFAFKLKTSQMIVKFWNITNDFVKLSGLSRLSVAW